MAFIQHRQALYFLFFFSVKTLLFPFGLQLGTGLQGVKKLLSGCGEQMPWHLRDTECSSPAWGWAFTRDTSPAQPAVVSQVVAIFLMSFTSSSRKWLSRKSQRWRSVRAESGACWSKRAFSVLLQDCGSSHAYKAFPHLSWEGICMSWKRVQPLPWFGSSRDTGYPHASPGPPGRRAGPCPPEPHHCSKK